VADHTGTEFAYDGVYEWKSYNDGKIDGEPVVSTIVPQDVDTHSILLPSDSIISLTIEFVNGVPAFCECKESWTSLTCTETQDGCVNCDDNEDGFWCKNENQDCIDVVTNDNNVAQGWRYCDGMMFVFLKGCPKSPHPFFKMFQNPKFSSNNKSHKYFHTPF